MVNKDLGRVSVILRGAYDPAAQYERLDCVSYEGSSYLVRKACQGITPSEGDYYQLAALAGSSAKADAAALAANAAAQNADVAAGRADVAAGNAQAAADAVSGDIAALRENLAANANADAVTRRSLDALWKLNQGVSYQFETDDAEAYSKTVPSGAKLASVEAVGGNTVAWNQIIPSKAAETKNGIVITPNGDGSYHIVGTASANVYFPFTTSSKTVSGHKYLFCGSPDGFGALTYAMQMYSNAIYLADNVGKIVTVNEGSDATIFQLFVGKSQTVDFVIRPFCVDLTQAFGVEKAETLTTDSSEIAWIRQYAETHPGYNAGELISAEIGAIASVGKNILNIKDIALINSNYSQLPTVSENEITIYTGVSDISFSQSMGFLYPVIGMEYLVGKKITFSVKECYSPDSANPAFFIEEYDKNSQKISEFGIYVKNKKERTFEVNSDTACFRVLFRADQNRQTYEECVTFIGIQIEINDMATEFSPYRLETYPIPEAVRTIPGYGWSAGEVYNSIERTDSGWQYVQRVGSRAYQEGDVVTDGVTIYYVLDNPVITDITDLMNGTLDAIPVEPGGTLTFENAAKLPVPGSVEYAVKLSEVIQ